MHTLLFILYSLLCGVAIVKMPFIRNSGIRPTLLLLLFALHVATGIAHNFIAYRYYPEHGDIWDYFWKSFMYRHRLVSDFPTFVADNASWTHLSHNGLIYVQMILNLFSFDHLDVNTLLFSFPVFLGNIALFRVFRHRFPNDPLTAFTVFLLPSVLFWTSCIHREGILYMLLGFLLLDLHRMMTSGYHTGRLIRSVFCFLLIFYFRSGFALAFLPAAFAWWYLEKKQLRPILAKIVLPTAAGVILLILAFPGFLPGTLAAWQNEFYSLYGHSRLPLPAMDGSWPGLFHVLPDAALNGLLEPLPGAGGQPIYLAFSIELLAIWAIVLIAFFKKISQPHDPVPAYQPSRNPDAEPSPSIATPSPLPFAIFTFLFSLSGMLLIGLFVPFAGAIVRYRSIYLLFLLAPSLHSLSMTPTIRHLNDWLSRSAFYKL